MAPAFDGTSVLTIYLENAQPSPVSTPTIPLSLYKVARFRFTIIKPAGVSDSLALGVSHNGLVVGRLKLPGWESPAFLRDRHTIRFVARLGRSKTAKLPVSTMPGQ